MSFYNISSTSFSFNTSSENLYGSDPEDERVSEIGLEVLSSNQLPANDSTVTSAVKPIKRYNYGDLNLSIIKNNIMRIVTSNEALDLIQGDDMESLFSAGYYEDGVTYLDLSLMSQNVDAIILLTELKSPFIPLLPKLILNRFESLIEFPDRCNRFREFIFELIREGMLEPIGFMRYFLTRYKSQFVNSVDHPQNIILCYQHLFGTIMRLKNINRALILAEVDLDNCKNGRRNWYGSCLGISSEYLIQDKYSSCLLL